MLTTQPNRDDQNDGDGLFKPKSVVRPRIQVEQQIRAAIMSGTLEASSRLPSEAELARMFGVSRNTVREALRSLETQNLIEKVPGSGGGSFVRRIDHQSLGDVLAESILDLFQFGRISFAEISAMRQYLEVPAVRLAALNRSEEQLETLKSIVEQERVQEPTAPDIPDLDAKFHSTMAEASGNQLLATFVRALHRETEPVSYLDLNPEVAKTAWVQHRRLVEAIERQDPDSAVDVITEHLEFLRMHIGRSIGHSATG